MELRPILHVAYPPRISATLQSFSTGNPTPFEMERSWQLWLSCQDFLAGDGNDGEAEYRLLILLEYLLDAIFPSHFDIVFARPEPAGHSDKSVLDLQL